MTENVRFYVTNQHPKITSLKDAIEKYDKMCDAAFLLLISEPKTKPVDIGLWRVREARKIAKRYLNWIKSIELDRDDWDELHIYIDNHISQELLKVQKMANAEYNKSYAMKTARTTI